MKVCIDYSDGEYYVKSTEDSELFPIHAEFSTVVELTAEQWEALKAHWSEAAKWQKLFRDADNSHG